jgi:O-antigen/teichoic acid export membrane protein
MGLYLLLFTSYDRLFDTWIINHFFGPGYVAVYGLAYKVYSNLVMPAYFFMASMYPLLAASSHPHLTAAYLRKSTYSLLFLSLGMYAVGFLLAPLLFSFFVNDSSSSGVLLLRLLGAALLFSYQNHLWGYYFIVRNRQITLLALGLCSLLVNLILNLLFIPHFGPIAAAFVTVITEACMYFGLRYLGRSL